MTAESIVQATDSPINVNLAIHARQTAYRSYVTGYKIPKACTDTILAGSVYCYISSLRLHRRLCLYSGACSCARCSPFSQEVAAGSRCRHQHRPCRAESFFDCRVDKHCSPLGCYYFAGVGEASLLLGHIGAPLSRLARLLRSLHGHCHLSNAAKPAVIPLHNRSGHSHVRRLTQRPLCDCVRATCSHPTTTFGSRRSRTMTCSSAAEATIRRGDTSDDHCNCMTRLPLQYCWICITVMTEMTALSVLPLGSAADHFPDPVDCPHDRRASDAFVLNVRDAYDMRTLAGVVMIKRRLLLLQDQPNLIPRLMERAGCARATTMAHGWRRLVPMERSGQSLRSVQLHCTLSAATELLDVMQSHGLTVLMNGLHALRIHD